MNTADNELVDLLDRATPRLVAVRDSEAALPLAPGKWSRKEVLGHLIDSASNNHQRFVRAHFQRDLVFPGYEQDDWVGVQRYREREWSELIALWSAFNRHVAHVIRATPRELCERRHARHNLHEIAWRTVPASEPTTLGYLHSDYVGHLRHHLRQALPGAEP